MERVDTFDHISRNHFVTRYAYHHGYFEGVEREFRGFGMVEQWDTEAFAALTRDGELPEAANLDAASHVPPVLTKTWFHTGIYVGRHHVSDFFAGMLDAHDRGEYYREPGLDDATAARLLLPDTELPSGLTAVEEREASRALKGSMLRQENYALDGTEQEIHPYTVTEQNFTLKQLQKQGANRHAVYFTHPRESITYHYERNPSDPRVQHTLTLAVDEQGNVQRAAAIAYGRRQPSLDLSVLDREKQAQTLITYSEHDFTNVVDEGGDWHTSLPSESRIFQLTGLERTDDAPRFTFDIVENSIQVAVAIRYSDSPDEGLLQKRLIDRARTLYRPDDCGVSQNDPMRLLPLGELQSRALLGESYQLALIPDLVTTIFDDRITDDLLVTEGGYVHSEGDTNWWIPSGRIFYRESGGAVEELMEATAHFFLPRRFHDAFGHNTMVRYDEWDLLLIETSDPLDNRTTVGERHPTTEAILSNRNDYRLLQPALVTDPNGNRAAVAFDALGLVVGTAVMGKSTETMGDSLTDFRANLTQAEIDRFFANPKGQNATNLLQNATNRIVYDVARYQHHGTDHPAFAAVLARETHASDPVPTDGLKIHVSIGFSDGFRREIQRKIQAEPGPLFEGGPTVSSRWVGSGWRVVNNKGKPVRQYEPFFDDSHTFRFARREGISPVFFYDPMGRVAATLHPNHTWEKVIFDPWRQETWDVNDTVFNLDAPNPKDDTHVGDFFHRLPDTAYLPTWHQLRTTPALAQEKWPGNDPAMAERRSAEADAAAKAELHAGTPTVIHLDSLGRPVLTIAHNRFMRGGAAVEEAYSTRTHLDIEGKPLAVIDDRGRAVMEHQVRTPLADGGERFTTGYDMAGNLIYQHSMDAGERRMLGNVASNPIRTWDERGHAVRTRYDELQRPIEIWVGDGASDRLAERTVYGEVLVPLQD